MSRAPRAVAVVAALAACLGAGGCTDDGEPAGDPSATQTAAATSPTTSAPTTPSTSPTAASGCYDDVSPARVSPALNNLKFPDDTIVYAADVRGDLGVLLTGVTEVSFRASAFQMRQRYSDPPFEIVGFDQAEDALAANWVGPSISGRWVVSDISERCPDNTEIQLLWTSQG